MKCSSTIHILWMCLTKCCRDCRCSCPCCWDGYLGIRSHQLHHISIGCALGVVVGLCRNKLISTTLRLIIQLMYPPCSCIASISSAGAVHYGDGGTERIAIPWTPSWLANGTHEAILKYSRVLRELCHRTASFLYSHDNKLDGNIMMYLLGKAPSISGSYERWN